jgi:Na+/proline symporter
MSPTLILLCVIAYSAMLFYVVWRTSRNADNDSYFIGNKSSRWYLVAYGMIGASLSGVTFMSVPGIVGTSHFSYMMVVFGYLIGYTIIATVLLPTYYRMNLTSIYTYLENRFGFWSYRTGSLFFILSRTVGASLRVYIVVNVLQTFVFDAWGIPFWLTVAIFIAMILLYTYKGGVKTIVWTDTLQTSFMLLSVVLSVILISRELNIGFGGIIRKITDKGYTQMINNDWRSGSYFLKHFFGGIFIAVAMTGLDQEMMQKNISVRTLKGSQKNMFTFSIVLVFINLLFLFLGALLYLYADSKGISIPQHADDLFPVIALNYLGVAAAVFFIIGLISAAYPSADGALTALTSSFCIDLIGIKRKNWSELKQKKIRHIVHISFAVLLLLAIVIFRMINDESVVNNLFKFAGYTYGPLLGLYAFGFLSSRAVKDQLVPMVCILSPFIFLYFDLNSMKLFDNYKFGFEGLICNALITFIGLFFISNKIQTAEVLK